MNPLRTINLVIAFLATTAPVAHVLEMPSKLTLEGPLWLDIQHNLYRGWGAVFGPVEILALAISALSLFVVRKDPALWRPYAIATACYAAMLVLFFVFNAPANAALNGWTATTLPADWGDWRLKWEIGHALAAVLSVFAFVVLIRARIRL